VKIAYLSCEVAPFSKTGGLADVAGSLPAALGLLGCEVLVLTPRYRGLPKGEKDIAPGVKAVFIENDAHFDREGIYGTPRGDHPDNFERFLFYSRRSLEVLKERGFKPDVLHANEWQTVFAILDLKTGIVKGDFFKNTKTFFTIHNLAYQGLFGLEKFRKAGYGAKALSKDGIEIWGEGNLLKGAIHYSDVLTTVSPTYAKEIIGKVQGCGLDAFLLKRRKDLYGILNGIDTETWNPGKDPALAKTFTADTAGDREASRRELARVTGLKEDRPIFGMVSRLVEQKGCDILAKVFGELMKAGGQFVLIGTGEERYERFFAKAHAQWKGQVSCHLKFDAMLAQKIYGGCDFFMMPSRFEPCGLGQLLAFRYGAIPVVHKTGGLADTVIDIDADPKKGTGIVFESYDAAALAAAVRRAAALYKNPKRLLELRARVMRLDFGWPRSAAKYFALYQKACGAKKTPKKAAKC
jgi:starch synthase